MIKLEKILQKANHEKLFKLAFFKNEIAKHQAFFKEFNIVCNPKDDVAYFQSEILYESIWNKKQLEDSFMESYSEMQDFWDDLDYQKRNQLVHVDMKRKCKDLKCFEYQNQVIYIPVFDLQLNHIYADEIVSLEMKKYRLLKKEFNSEISNGHYGSNPYRHHFASADWIADDEHGYCLYFPILNRFYYIVNEVCEKTLNLDPTCKERLNDEQKKIIAMMFMNNHEKALAELIIEQQYVDIKTQKRIQRYLHKMNF